MQILFTDGLGNQMFQYALYLSMLAKGKKPKLNIGIISRNIVHNGFELCDDFEIDRNALEILDGGKMGGGATIYALRHLRSLCYREKEDCFDPGVFSSRKPIVYGYWQDERYFSDVSNDVRNAFTFKGIDPENHRLGEEMASCQSICLHIRRGDYLKYPNLMVCSPSYYKRAILHIKEQIESPVFYIFSDDLEWSESFIKKQGVDYKIVSINRGSNSYKDMYLMTRCKHNIIANSSFSWWGAWLGNQEDKIVVCPDEWKKGSNKNPCPNKWFKINYLDTHGGYYQTNHSLYEILCHEYKGLKTGRRPVAPFAIKAYYCNDNFRLIVLMRIMLKSKSSIIKRKIKRKLIQRYGAEISPRASIGDRMRFHHTVGVVIGDYVRIGNDCNIFQGVLLGQAKGVYPSIGNNVTLYPYSCVLGDVHVGNNVIILAHSVVLHDIPDNCMVGGNPAKIIKTL